MDNNQIKILVVDDQPHNLRFLSKMLTEHGYKVQRAISGQLALNAAIAHPPDLILLDILMPDMNGYEICQKLKEIDKIREIPVIFLSALSEASDKVKAFEIGGVDYITKPFQINEALARIENQISIQKLQKELKEQNALLQQEIRDRQQAEQQMEQLNEELKRSNKELEQFAYVASHDLQAPLANMASYAQLLERRYNSQLDAKANQFIDKIIKGAVRMQMLIDDLLEYSQLGRIQGVFKPCDCNIVMEEAIANLQLAIRKSQAVITHSNLPVVMADSSQLVQLFQNLIGNAIKYRGNKPPAIHVNVFRDKDAWLFSVKDNGIGIDPQHSDRIFQIFQRLHAQNEYSGTGIGLAICQKIVERHGGQIWVDSQPSHGSTFYFTLPDKNP